LPSRLRPHAASPFLPSTMSSICSAADVDSTWAHAARLGFAWRRLRKDVSLCCDPDSAIIFDLHAELLQRLGHRLRPLPCSPLPHNLRLASSDVRSALGYLRVLASRPTTSSALPSGGSLQRVLDPVTDKLHSNTEVLDESGLSVDYDSSFGTDRDHGNDNVYDLLHNDSGYDNDRLPNVNVNTLDNDKLFDDEVLGTSVGSLGGSLRVSLVDLLSPVEDSLHHVEAGLYDVQVLVAGCSLDLADALLRVSALEIRQAAELADFRSKLLLCSGPSFVEVAPQLRQVAFSDVVLIREFEVGSVLCADLALENEVVVDGFSPCYMCDMGGLQEDDEDCRFCRAYWPRCPSVSPHFSSPAGCSDDWFLHDLLFRD